MSRFAEPAPAEDMLGGRFDAMGVDDAAEEAPGLNDGAGDGLYCSSTFSQFYSPGKEGRRGDGRIEGGNKYVYTIYTHTHTYIYLSIYRHISKMAEKGKAKAKAIGCSNKLWYVREKKDNFNSFVQERAKAARRTSQ